MSTRLAAIADVLAGIVDATPELELARAFRGHVRRLRLDRPRAPDIAVSRCLAPAPTRAELHALIEGAHAALDRNPHLHTYLDALADADAPGLARCLQREGTRVLADVLCHALVLERVTRTVRADPRALRALIDHLRTARAQLRWRRHAPLFLALKLESVERPLRRLLGQIEAGVIDPHSGKWALPINIAEASVVDWLGGRPDNAAVGWLLARTCCGRARLTRDGSGVAWARTASKAWNDLYTVWDIEFIVGLYANFPYVLAKLLIPSVSGYAREPDGYIWNRGLALYLQVHWGVFLRCELGGGLNLDWPHAELTGPGGASNRACAASFRSQWEQERASGVAPVCPSDASPHHPPRDTGHEP